METRIVFRVDGVEHRPLQPGKKHFLRVNIQRKEITEPMT